jgi:hypothetical protein
MGAKKTQAAIRDALSGIFGDGLVKAERSHWRDR